MITRFIQNIQKYAGNEKKFLLAVSGGLDSTLMVHFAKEAGLDFGIAHCNFQLRGAESDAEEDFVKKLALQLGISFFAVKFDTRQWLADNNMSLQEGARKLRYDWLEEVRVHQDYDYIMTAHHLNDSLETFLYNLSKGTGIKGLTGIPAKNGQIIRPMLTYSRSELKNHAREHDINYCLDSSNEKDDYARNKIRHHIIPILREINPSLEETFKNTLSNLKEASNFIDTHLKKLFHETVFNKNGIFYLSKSKLQNHPNAKFFLFEFLQPYGYNGEVVNDVLEKANQGNGQTWLGNGVVLWNEREYWVLEPAGFHPSPPLMLSNNPGTIRFENTNFNFELLTYVPENFQNAPPTIAYLDADRISWPIVFRHWEEGDIFQPLGMQGQSQKLQDFFINQKVDRFQKKRVILLESGNKIAWVVNMRISDAFKITRKTRNVLKIEM